MAIKKTETPLIERQLRQAELVAAKRGFVVSKVAIEGGTAFSVWNLGTLLLKVEAMNRGTCVSRYYDAKGTTIRVTTSDPWAAIRQL